jgi:hypothetical protein
MNPKKPKLFLVWTGRAIKVLVVEGYVGNFEALLRDPNTGLPVGLLKLTVPSTSQSLTASLAFADEAKPLALAGPLEPGGECNHHLPSRPVLEPVW